MTTHSPLPVKLSGWPAYLLILLFLSGCSASQVVVRTTAMIMDGGVEAMNRETDIDLARSAIPAQLKLVEGLIIEDPDNPELRVYAAQALYGYGFSFLETSEPKRAGALYRRGFEHMRVALRSIGIKEDLAQMKPDQVRAATAGLSRDKVPVLFWTASLWAKWIDMNRDDPTGISQLSNAAALMERVLVLDESYYFASPHIFFGVYYGSRPPMLGGDYARATQHFERASSLNGGRFLMGDLMRAEFLDRQQLNQDGFHQRLTAIVNSDPNLLPEMALANAIARHRAGWLLSKEGEWF